MNLRLMLKLFLILILFGCNQDIADENKFADCDYSIKFTSAAFKTAYEAWCKAIQNPKISVQSRNEAYQEIPEYKAMINVGEPALEDIQVLMERKIGMYHMPYLAVIRIKKWELSDFQKIGLSNQEISEQVLKKLKAER